MYLARMEVERLDVGVDAGRILARYRSEGKACEEMYAMKESGSGMGVGGS